MTNTKQIELSEQKLGLSQRAQLAAGQPIGPLMANALANPDLISLAAGFVDGQTLPVEIMQQATASLLEKPQHARQALQYGTNHGSQALRKIVLDRFSASDQTDPAELDLDQVFLTAGSNQFLHLVCEATLNPGDLVLCCAPTYLVFVGTVANLGAHCYSVEVDDQGMVPESLESTLQQLEFAGELHRVKQLYLVTYSDNPRGVTTGVTRRSELAKVAAKWMQKQPFYLIEDLAYRELSFTQEDPPSFLAYQEVSSRVIVAGTYSKSFAPGVRVGWGIIPKELISAIHDLKGNIDFGSPHFNQQVLTEIHQQALYDSHVSKLCTEYQEKRDAMLAALDKAFADHGEVKWTIPTGGLYIWLELPEEIDTGYSGKFFKLATEKGVSYVPGEYCYPSLGQEIKKNCMRLSYGVQTPEKIRQGIQYLAEALLQV